MVLRLRGTSTEPNNPPFFTVGYIHRTSSLSISSLQPTRVQQNTIHIAAPTMVELHRLYEELQKDITTIEKERGVLKEQFAILPPEAPSSQPNDKSFRLINNILIANLWAQSNHSLSKFRELILQEEENRGQKVFQLRIAQVPLVPTAEQQIQQAEAQRNERIRLASIARDEKLRLAEIAKEERLRIAELANEENHHVNEIAKEGRLRLEEIQSQDRERNLLLETERVKVEADIRKQEIAAEKEKENRVIVLKELEIKDEKDKRRTQVALQKVGLKRKSSKVELRRKEIDAQTELEKLKVTERMAKTFVDGLEAVEGATMDIALGSHVSIKSRDSSSSNASTTILGETDNPSAERFASFLARLAASRKRTESETASFSGASILTASTLAPESSASLKSDKGKGKAKASEESGSSGAGTSSSSSFIFSPSSPISSSASVASSSTLAASSASSRDKGKGKASDEASSSGTSTENRESPRRKTLTIFTDAGTIQITPQGGCGGGGSIGFEGTGGCGSGQSLVERYQELTKMLKGRGIFQTEDESEDEDDSLPRPEIPPEEFESILLEYLQIRSILRPLLKAKERRKQAGASSTN
ncbi:MAG: hypothetical protein J3Q66DRAFT_205212 [Benniella sp.]|nr:MAG: hypothetical protein J3Q66DRAFT_205212 [Benniella sp.]